MLKEKDKNVAFALTTFIVSKLQDKTRIWAERAQPCIILLAALHSQFLHPAISSFHLSNESL